VTNWRPSLPRPPPLSNALLGHYPFREGWLLLREVESYTTVSSPGPTNYVSQGYETPPYVYGEEGPDLPQLFLEWHDSQRD
jgi:hypothetical protein